MMFDVLSTRELDNGGKVKAIIAGPYNEIEAAYQCDRLQQQADRGYLYSVVEHHVCDACYGDPNAEHSCIKYLRNL